MANKKPPTLVERELAAMRWRRTVRRRKRRRARSAGRMHEATLRYWGLPADSTQSPTPICGNCRDTGHVCENHTRLPWGPLCCDANPGDPVCDHLACHCGGAGEPCPSCCDPIPQDGTSRIGDAFTPRHLKQGSLLDAVEKQAAEWRDRMRLPDEPMTVRIHARWRALVEAELAAWGAPPGVTVRFINDEGEEEQ